MRSTRFESRGGRNTAFTLTNGVLASLVVAFVVSWFQIPLFENLAFVTIEAMSRPWTFLTYPWGMIGDGTRIIWDLILLLWFYQIGNMLEKQAGVATWAAVFGAGIVMPAACLLAAPNPVLLSGAYVPAAALGIYWCGLSPNESAHFWGLPVARKWLALVLMLLVVFAVGTGQPVAGFLAGVPLGVLYVAGVNGIQLRPGTIAARRDAKKKQAEFNTFIDDVRTREQEREERERLRKLFESSIQDDSHSDDDRYRSDER
ncbi:MAG: hypothetical protein KF812_05495 [Fimbriimonadaceae bacterium]|nr:hypothetical protein [Fimbriimonadaceae bacterium]